jgi:universal stress protein family protein
VDIAVGPDLSAVERAGVEEVESVVLAVSATEALTARSRGAGLVVVGSYGEGARSGMLAGSAALALLEASQCPVAVVRGAAPGLAPPRRGPVVVGTDAVTDDDALHLGAALAVGLGARLSVLHAWSDIVEDAQSVHRTISSGTELAALAVARLDTCLRPLREAHPELPIERHVVDDTALRALLDHASGHRPRHSARAGTDGPRRAPTAPAPVTVVIGAPGRPPAADLRAGRAVETVRLTATALGLDLHVRAAPATATSAIERCIGRTTDTLAVVQIGRPVRGEDGNCDRSDRRAT